MVFDPAGKHLKDVTFPAYNPACTAWGGKNFDIIFMATGKNKRKDAPESDEGGHMFRYKPNGPKGYPKFEFDG